MDDINSATLATLGTNIILASRQLKETENKLAAASAELAALKREKNKSWLSPPLGRKPKKMRTNRNKNVTHDPQQPTIFDALPPPPPPQKNFQCPTCEFGCDTVQNMYKHWKSDDNSCNKPLGWDNGLSLGVTRAPKATPQGAPSAAGSSERGGEWSSG